jgi:ATP-dependent Lhr-like helicase
MDPFTVDEVAARLGLGPAVVAATLQTLAEAGRTIEGEFRPGGHGREWCDADVLRTVRSRSLAALRKEVEPVEPHVLGRFLVSWHGLTRPRAGLDALLDVGGAPAGRAARSLGDSNARSVGASGSVRPALLDTLVSAGEVTWLGVEPLGERDGRIALYLTDQLPLLVPPASNEGLLDREARILAWLIRSGASFFGPLHEAAGGGFPQETVDALWNLVWKGLVTNDTLHPLRAYTAGPQRSRREARARRFRSRRLVPASAEGRWSAVSPAQREGSTAWVTAITQQLLSRHGVVARDVTTVEPVPGGFSTIYPVLRRLEDTDGCGAAISWPAGRRAVREPGAIDLLRAERDPDTAPVAVTLAATDPANPYGALIEWPAWGGSSQRASRRLAHASCLVDGYATGMDRARRSIVLVAVPMRIRIARDDAWHWRARWCASRSCRRPNAVDGWSRN